MKFVVIFALICAGICYADPQRTFTTAGKTNATVLNIENIYAERTMYKVHNQTVTLPRVRFNLIHLCFLAIIFSLKKNKLINYFLPLLFNNRPHGHL